MRAHVSKIIRDNEGTVIAGASVRVLNASTTTPVAGTLYAASVGNETYANPFVATSGVISFYLAEPQRVRLGVTPVNGSEVFYEDIDVIVAEDVFEAPAETFQTAAETPFTASGTLGSTDVQAAIDEVSGDVSAHLADTADAHDASAISFAPAGTIAATDVQAAVEEVSADANAAQATATTAGNDIAAHLADTTDAHDASAISYAGAAGLAATDVEAALDELDSEKAATGHTHASTRYALSTVSAGLPSFTGRLAGDLHYDETAHREFVLTGLAGASATDSFERAVGTAGSGWGSTETGGFTWVVDYGSINSVAGGASRRARLDSGSGARYGYINVPGIGTSSCTMSAKFSFVGGGSQAYMGLRTSSAFSGYQWYTNGTNAQAYRAGNGQGPSTGVVLDSDVFSVEVSVVNGVTTIYWRKNNVVIHSLVDGAPLTGTHVSFSGGSNATNEFDDFTFTDSGTLLWQQVNPIYLSQRAPGAQVVTANAIPPGIRVPASTTARDLIARLDTGNTGADFIVVFERWNGGGFAENLGTVTITPTTFVATTPVVKPMAKGDIIKFNVTQVGSTVAGSDLLVSLDCY